MKLIKNIIFLLLFASILLIYPGCAIGIKSVRIDQKIHEVYPVYPETDLPFVMCIISGVTTDILGTSITIITNRNEQITIDIEEETQVGSLKEKNVDGEATSGSLENILIGETIGAYYKVWPNGSFSLDSVYY